MTTDIGAPAPPRVGPPLPYHRPDWSSARPVDRIAEGLLEVGLIRAGERDPIPLMPPFGWRTDPDLPTPADLGSWEFLDPLLEMYSETREPRYLEPAVDLARDWIRSHRDQTNADPVAVRAARAWRLAYILAEAERYGGFGPGELQPMWDLASQYEAALATDPGVPATCGLLALVTRLSDRRHQRETEAQVAALEAFRNAFGPDGVHRSHDPARHNAELGLLTAVLRSEMLEAPDLADVQERAEEALAWFVLPDGTLATFGDTGEQYISPAWDGPQISLRFVADRYRTEALRHLASMGRIGAPPQAGFRVFPDSGYLVIRPARRFTRDRDPGASYVALQAGSDRSRHPQRDDLAIVWFDRGRRILVNGGARPPAPPDATAVEYFVSPRAHNTVTIDGRRPTGEATIERWGELRGVVFADACAEVDTVIHRRSVMTKPTEWLLVVDMLHDNVGATHNYRQWFHAAEDFDLVKDGRRYMLTDIGNPLAFAVPLRSSQQPLTPLRRKTAPQLNGWWAPRAGVMVPNWAFGWELNGAQGTFATLFTFDRPATPIPCPEGSIGWVRDGVHTQITLRDIGFVDIIERPADPATETA
jgi:hypothetical protein